MKKIQKFCEEFPWKRLKKHFLKRVYMEIHLKKLEFKQISFKSNFHENSKKLFWNDFLKYLCKHSMESFQVDYITLG